MATPRRDSVKAAKRKICIEQIIAVCVQSHERLLAVRDLLGFLQHPHGVRWSKKDIRRLEQIRKMVDR